MPHRHWMHEPVDVVQQQRLQSLGDARECAGMSWHRPGECVSDVLRAALRGDRPVATSSVGQVARDQRQDRLSGLKRGICFEERQQCVVGHWHGVGVGED